MCVCLFDLVFKSCSIVVVVGTLFAIEVYKYCVVLYKMDVYVVNSLSLTHSNHIKYVKRYEVLTC